MRVPLTVKAGTADTGAAMMRPAAKAVDRAATVVRAHTTLQRYGACDARGVTRASRKRCEFHGCGPRVGTLLAWGFDDWSGCWSDL